MTREEKIIVLSQALSPDKAFLEQAATRINEKTDEQLDYILSPIDKCIYLEACAGSGKTEVLGIKAAYEISRWASQQSGLAVLSFTNEATSTIANRIAHFIANLFHQGILSEPSPVLFMGILRKDSVTTFSIFPGKRMINHSKLLSQMRVHTASNG